MAAAVVAQARRHRNTSPPSDTWLTNPRAISVLDTLPRYSEERAALSPTV
jgi:hypothetical protein